MVTYMMAERGLGIVGRSFCKINSPLTYPEAYAI